MVKKIKLFENNIYSINNNNQNNKYGCIIILLKINK